MKTKLTTKIILFVLLFGSFFFLSELFFNKEKNDSDSYFKKFNISFSGIVVSKKFIDNDIGLVKVKLSYSSTQIYDPRDSLTRYFCVIKNGYAEFILGPYEWIQTGDSIWVNGKTKELIHFRDKDTINYCSPINNLVGPGFFYLKMKKLHSL